jgi:DNA repair protein RadC
MDQLNLFNNLNKEESKENKEVKEVAKVIKFPVESQEVKKEEPQEQEESTSSINMIELKAVRKPIKINQSTKIRNPQHARDIINELYDLENIAEEKFILLSTTLQL